MFAVGHILSVYGPQFVYCNIFSHSYPVFISSVQCFKYSRSKNASEILIKSYNTLALKQCILQGLPIEKPNCVWQAVFEKKKLQKIREKLQTNVWKMKKSNVSNAFLLFHRRVRNALLIIFNPNALYKKKKKSLLSRNTIFEFNPQLETKKL